MFSLCVQLFYKGKYIPVGRRVFREKLVVGRKQKSPIILLPPYISIHELRLMLNINYETCFKAANVYKSGNKYRWKDSDGRVFQTVNKRNVIIPYHVAAYVSKIFKFKPKLIQMELFCEEKNRTKKTLLDVYKATYAAEQQYENNRNGKLTKSGWSYIPSRGVIFPYNKRDKKKYIAQLNDAYDGKDLTEVFLGEEVNKSDERKNFYTVISVIGHINHGKTTMLDKITNNNLALSEAGCITQNIKPIHFDFGPFKFTFLDTPGHKVFQIFRGRAAFLSDILIVLISLEVGAEIQTEEAIKYADKFNIPVIFVLNKADIYKENEEVVKAELKNQCIKMYDDGDLKYNYEKEIDNSITISSLTGYNLNRLINRIYFISNNINLPHHSANGYYNNDEYVKKISHFKYYSQNNIFKEKKKKCICIYDEEIIKEKRNIDLNLLKKYIRKSDCLLALDINPFGMGIVIDISKDSCKGTILHVIVRNGFFLEGNYFICGSAYGKINKMYKFNNNFEEYCNYASIGMAIKISGIKKYGNATTDDLIFNLPQNHAFRLCQYRLMIEKLNTLQISGNEIYVSWENDMRKNEFHAEDIYDNRLEMSDKRKAIEEFGINDDYIFENVSMKDFHKSNTQMRKEDNEIFEIELEEEHKYQELKNKKRNKIQTILSKCDDNECILVPEESTFLFFDESKNDLQKNTNRNTIHCTHPYNLHAEKLHTSLEESNTQKEDHNNARHSTQFVSKKFTSTDQFILINDSNNIPNNNHVSKMDNHNRGTKTYCNDTKHEHKHTLEKEIIDNQEKGKKVEEVHDKCVHNSANREMSIIPFRGRKSKLSKNTLAMNKVSAQGDNTSSQGSHKNTSKLNEPWYYEESEETWTKKVLQRNEELMENWRNKTRQREIEKERQMFYEKQMILKNEMIKRNLLGEEKLTEEEINAFLYNEKSKKRDDTDTSQDNEEMKMPKKNCPVIPIIIRTNYVGMFDIFLDEFENLQKKYNVKISVVHGGIGPITPNDVVHAEVESNYGYCCIYAFNVKILPDSVKQAVLSNVVIKQFDVFTDLIDDVVQRIKNIKALIAHNMYVRSLKSERTQEGL
ncbi:translation initiation factor IF-2, putative [Plasmodium ovale]|uniref:Translation initiation factor IF-2, putative n=2 Tax=Plasmodium ovale TaxID=36330 RepID=A0A1D3U9E3_PLAOA|nr:translation initiation factor IF-2, putative (IF2a) [Plasmodium ovale curtisi]SBS97986.1 translation initiation factor IF-2, putative (IF2a) [Plasmodium ovale curtisi]SCQ16766.1 translation initiation factor IF-2, putative [Plasmodium ovale]